MIADEFQGKCIHGFQLLAFTLAAHITTRKEMDFYDDIDFDDVEFTDFTTVCITFCAQ